MTPEQLEARNAAIRAAWDDPLRRALQRSRTFTRLGLPEDHERDLNAYQRAYAAKRRKPRVKAPPPDPETRRAYWRAAQQRCRARKRRKAREDFGASS